MSYRHTRIGRLTSLFVERRKLLGLRARTKSIITMCIVVLCASHEIVQSFGQSFGQNQEKIDALEQRIKSDDAIVNYLTGQVRNLSGQMGVVLNRLSSIEMIQKSGVVAFGFYDDGDIQFAWSKTPTDMVRMTTGRPGEFILSFVSARDRIPIIIATSGGKYGSINLDRTTVQVRDIDHNGATIETFRAAERGNVQFMFVVIDGVPALPAK